MSKVAQQVAEILECCKRRGVTISCRDTVVTVDKRFAAGNRQAYCEAENDCLDVLGKCKATQPGSTWGTDSGSVGGAIGCDGGYCRLNKSGVGKRLVAALKSAIEKLHAEML